MAALAGAFLGAMAGFCTWAASRLLVARYAAQGAGDSGRRPTGSAPGGRPAAAVLTACLALLGIYLGSQAAGLPELITVLVATGLLASASLVDLQVHRIPNVLVLALLLWAVVQALWLGKPAPVNAGLGLLASGGIFLLISLVGRGAMGSGDVKLAAAVGALLGVPLVLPAILLGTILGGVAALILLATRRVGRKDPIAYGPYIALGAWITWLGSFGIWPW